MKPQAQEEHPARLTRFRGRCVVKPACCKGTRTNRLTPKQPKVIKETDRYDAYEVTVPAATGKVLKDGEASNSSSLPSRWVQRCRGSAAEPGRTGWVTTGNQSEARILGTEA